MKKFRRIFFFSDFFDFLSKTVYFSKTNRYFFLVVPRPLEDFLRLFWEKLNNKKINKFIKKVRTFFRDFFDFLSKKVTFSKTIQYFFLVLSKPCRRFLITFSVKNLKKNCQKISNFFFKDFFDFLSKKAYFSKTIQYFVKASKSA